MKYMINSKFILETTVKLLKDICEKKGVIINKLKGVSMNNFKEILLVYYKSVMQSETTQ